MLKTVVEVEMSRMGGELFVHAVDCLANHESFSSALTQTHRVVSRDTTHARGVETDGAKRRGEVFVIRGLRDMLVEAVIEPVVGTDLVGCVEGMFRGLGELLGKLGKRLGGVSAGRETRGKLLKRPAHFEQPHSALARNWGYLGPPTGAGEH